MTNEAYTYTSDEEEQQLRKLQSVRKQTQAILLRHAFAIGVMFVVCFGATMWYFGRKALKSPTRFTATTKLLYYPNPSDKIKNLDNQQVYELLTRPYMWEALGEQLKLAGHSPSGLFLRVKISQPEKLLNQFIITGTAATGQEAIAVVNSFAELCISEYENFHRDELDKWRDTMKMRKAINAKSMQDVENKMTDLTKDIIGGSAESELQRVYLSLTEHRKRLSEVNIQRNNCIAKQNDINLVLKTLSPVMVQSASAIQGYMENIDRLEKETARLRQMYTDKNPRVNSVLVELKKAQDEYQDFLKENKLENVTREQLSLAYKVYNEQQEVAMKMAGLLENIRVLEAEIKEEEERTRHISDILPQINQLKQEAQALSSTSRDIESQLTEIENLKTDTKAELTQVAKAAYASASGFLSTKVFLFSAISGCMGGGVLGFVILTIAMAFGKVRNLKELTFHPELTTLGVIPLKYEGIATNQEEKLVADGIYYKFQTADIKKKLLFACCLPGAESNKFLQETLDWNYIMSGQKMIWLRLVSAMNYEDVEEAEHYSLVVANQNVGDIPVENTFALSPSEQLLLTRDIDDLRKAGYDLIIIDGVEPLKRSGVLFNQMMDMCEGVLLSVGAEKSSRSMLRYVIKVCQRDNKSILATLTRKHVSLEESNQ